jgi:hypothetical protein
MPQLARRIFGTLENGRIDRLLRRKYRGLGRDLDLIRDHLRSGRPRITELPASLVPFELLFQVTLLGGAVEDARQYYSQILSELETIVVDYLSNPSATVSDSLMATSRVYDMFQSVTTDDSMQQIETTEDEAERNEEDSAATERLKQRQTQRVPGTTRCSRALQCVERSW